MQHAAHGSGIVVHLRLVPDVFEADDSGFVAFGRGLLREQNPGEKDRKKEDP
jgi:ferredoxin